MLQLFHPAFAIKEKRRLEVNTVHLTAASFDRNQHQGGIKQSSPCYLLHAGLLLGLFFDPEDGGDMFLRKVGSLAADYKLHPNR
jgi:hypothetical protein